MTGAVSNDSLSATVQKSSRVQKPTFTSLPLELKYEILRNLEPKFSEWKNARLVCHDWAETTASLLFGELWLTPATLYRCKDSRALQGIHTYVNHVVLYSDILPKIPLRRWKSKYYHASKWGEAKWSQYRTAYCHQERCIEDVETKAAWLLETGDVPATMGRMRNGKFRTFFMRVIHSMDNLVKVTIADRDWCSTNKGNSLLPVTTWSEAWRNLHNVELDKPVSDQAAISTAILDTVLMGLAECGKPIRYLHAGMISYLYFTHLRSLLSISGTSQNNLMKLFKNLRTIYLGLSGPGIWIDSSIQIVKFEFRGGCSSAMEGLQGASLDVPGLTHPVVPDLEFLAQVAKASISLPLLKQD
ncbi:MAG: hypothetical protein Q9222_006708 [Ikaeria aurantiellina]